MGAVEKGTECARIDKGELCERSVLSGKKSNLLACSRDDPWIPPHQETDLRARVQTIQQAKQQAVTGQMTQGYSFPSPLWLFGVTFIRPIQGWQL
jgi:hypothetical protein